MIAKGPEPGTTRHDWWPLIAAAAVYAIVIAVLVFVRTSGVDATDDYATAQAKTTSDFRDFWWTAKHFRQTGEITTSFGVHNYLPFFTIFMLPWSLLPLQVAATLFSLLSLGLFAIAAMLTENLLSDGWRRRPRAALLVALGLALAYVHACAIIGNVGLLMVFLVVTAWFLVERGREWEAGAALGLAAMIKLLPAALVVYFVLKRRWRVAGGAAVVVVVLGGGLPLVALGPQETLTQHKAFYERAIIQHSAMRTLTAEKPVKAFYSNNAVPMVLRRLLTHTNCGKDEPDGRLFVNIADLPPAASTGIYVLLMAVIGGTSVWVALRRPDRWPPESIEAGRSLRAQFAAWCCLMLLASPLVWTHYLPLVYWALALVADRAERTHRSGRTACAVSRVALILWLLGAVLLAWPAARAVGAQIASVAVLWVASVWIATRPVLAASTPRR